jgi:cGMP-dependent protein kinase
MLLSSYESGPVSPMTDYDEEDLASGIVVCTSTNNNNDNKLQHRRRHNDSTDFEEDDGVSDKDDEEEEEEVECEPERVKLSELRWVSTLGVGGFGRVELVTAGRNNNTAFALKKMKKVEVILFSFICRNHNLLQ